MATWAHRLRALFLGLGLTLLLAPPDAWAGSKPKVVKKKSTKSTGAKKGKSPTKGGPAAPDPAGDEEEDEPAALAPAPAKSAPAAAAPAEDEPPPPPVQSDAPRANKGGASVAMLELRAIDPDLPGSVVPAINTALRAQLEAQLAVA